MSTIIITLGAPAGGTGTYHTHTSTRTSTDAIARTHNHTSTHTHSYTHIHTHTHIQTHRHTHTHTHTHTRTITQNRTHTHKCMRWSCRHDLARLRQPRASGLNSALSLGVASSVARARRCRQVRCPPARRENVATCGRVVHSVVDSSEAHVGELARPSEWKTRANEAA